MNDYAFVKGDDIVIKLDGEILGGVQKAVCTSINTVEKIEEFLNDEPVEKIPRSKYSILLVMHSKSQCPFENTVFDCIEFFDELNTVAYENCNVDSIESEIKSKGYIEFRVKITAESRQIK